MEIATQTANKVSFYDKDNRPSRVDYLKDKYSSLKDSYDT